MQRIKNIVTKDNIEALIALTLIIAVCLSAPTVVELAVKLGVLIGDKL